MNTPGYEQLAAVLQAAYDQAATGKGAERHADSKPFHEQPMQTGSDLLGTDAGLAFQAIKKVREGSTFAEFERFEREMLGAINYIAGMVIWRRRQLPDAPSFTARPAKDVLAEVDETARRIGAATQHPQCCPECDCPTDAAGTHYATCSKLTAPKEFVEQVEQTFDELEGVEPTHKGKRRTRAEIAADLAADPAEAKATFEWDGSVTAADADIEAEEDAADQRMDNIARNGNDGAVYNDPWAGAPEWAKYKAQDANGTWYWYSCEVYASGAQWVGYGESYKLDEAGAGEPNPKWLDTLIQRP